MPGSLPRIGDGYWNVGKTLIIAEIGTSHGGSLEKAARLIDAAAAAGADCIKFQHVYAHEIIHPETGLVPLPGGSIPLYDRFRSLETGPDFLAKARELTEAAGALFLCTPFGIRSARELRDLGVQAFKIASPELNHVLLLDEIASYGMPVILSSGVALLSDIERALGRFGIRAAGSAATTFSAPASPATPATPATTGSTTGSTTGATKVAEPAGAGVAMTGNAATAACRTALLHCVTAYPAPETDYNLSVLRPLATLFGVPVGVSDHSMDPLLVPVLGVVSGASIIEKHICLSRSDDGLDDPVALEPADFGRMVRAIREAGQAIRDGDRDRVAGWLVRDYGEERVKATLGSGMKVLAPSEAANYSRTNRSMHAVRRIAAGEWLTDDNVAMLRTEKVLRPGLEPHLWPVVRGRLAVQDIPDGEGIRWEDIGQPG